MTAGRRRSMICLEIEICSFGAVIIFASFSDSSRFSLQLLARKLCTCHQLRGFRFKCKAFIETNKKTNMPEIIGQPSEPSNAHQQWHFIVRTSTEYSSGFLFINASPLFEEKRYALFIALLSNVPNPPFLDRPRFTSALTSNDYPVYILKI